MFAVRGQAADLGVSLVGDLFILYFLRKSFSNTIKLLYSKGASPFTSMMPWKIVFA